MAGLALLVSLAIGILGYHSLVGLPWLDSVLNAAMIPVGMGPVDPSINAAGKWFATFYALFSGIIFLVIAGIVIAPVAHQLRKPYH